MTPAFLRSTRARLTLAYAVQFLVVVSAAAIGFWVASSQFEFGAVDASLRAQGNAVRATVEQSPLSGTPVLPTRSSTGLPIESFLVSSDGALIAQSTSSLTFDSISSLVPPNGFPAHAELETVSLREGSMRVLLRQVVLPGGRAGGMILIRPIDDLENRLFQTALLLALAGTGLVLASSLLAWRLAGRALAPVREMSGAARAITEQDLHRRLPVQMPANDELGQLAMTFNAMLARLELAFASLQRFTADAAHELRAPLAIIRTQIEVTQRRPRTQLEYAESNATLLGEVERLSRITDQLLMLARADAGALEARLVITDLPDLLEEVIDRWRPTAAHKDVSLVADLPSEGQVRGDRDLLKRLLDNLLDNALRHVPRHGEVRLTAESTNVGWSIAVSDSGSGVPAESARHLFERFSRDDPARQRATGGAGLGLSICAVIAHLHGGVVELAATGPLAGACFVLRLPLAIGPDREPAPSTAGRPLVMPSNI